MFDAQHVAELAVTGAVNIVVAVKVLQARLNATDKRVDQVQDDLEHERSRIDSILLNK